MGKQKLKFEVKFYRDGQSNLSKGIFIDDRHFDWGVDEESYKDAASMGPHYLQLIESSIAKHFIESLSEFMNRKVTFEEVEEAKKTGFIDK